MGYSWKDTFVCYGYQNQVAQIGWLGKLERYCSWSLSQKPKPLETLGSDLSQTPLQLQVALYLEHCQGSSLHVAFSHVSLYVQIFPLYKSSGPTGLGANSSETSSSIILSIMISSPGSVSKAIGVRTSTSEFCG